jgi:hypothetical protein
VQTNIDVIKKSVTKKKEDVRLLKRERDQAHRRLLEMQALEGLDERVEKVGC